MLRCLPVTFVAGGKVNKCPATLCSHFSYPSFLLSNPELNFSTTFLRYIPARCVCQAGFKLFFRFFFRAAVEERGKREGPSPQPSPGGRGSIGVGARCPAPLLFVMRFGFCPVHVRFAVGVRATPAGNRFCKQGTAEQIHVIGPLS